MLMGMTVQNPKGLVAVSLRSIDAFCRTKCRERRLGHKGSWYRRKQRPVKPLVTTAGQLTMRGGGGVLLKVKCDVGYLAPRQGAKRLNQRDTKKDRQGGVKKE